MFRFNLKPQEQLVSMLRQTEFVLVRPFFIIFIALYVPWFLLIKYDLIYTLRWWLLVWTGLIFLYAVYQYMRWLLTVYLITNVRVVSISYPGLFKKIVTETPVGRISNISFHSTGLFATLMRYGDVSIHVMNVADPLIFFRVRHPNDVKDTLWHVASGSSQP